jgi:hypothetical protein
MKYIPYNKIIVFFLLIMSIGSPQKLHAKEHCNKIFKKPFTVEEDAFLTVAEFYIINYLEAKMKNVGHSKIKLKQLVYELEKRGDYRVLTELYEELGGLLIIYQDKFFNEMYHIIKDMLDAHNAKDRVDASTVVGIQEQ